MIKFESEDFGACAVVHELDMQHFTRDGWVLRAMSSEAFPEIVNIATPSHNNENGQWVAQSTRSEVHLVTKTKYVISQPKDETLKKIAAELDTALLLTNEFEVKVRNAEFKQKEAALLLEKAEKELAADKADKARYMREASAARANHAQVADETRALLEKDQVASRLLAVEDWVIRFVKTLPEEELKKLEETVGAVPVKSRRTWQERLLEDSVT